MMTVLVFKENLDRKQYQKAGIKELQHQCTRRETGNRVEICCVLVCQTFKIYERILANKMIKRNQGRN
jgi:hypothetical protein